MNADTRDCIITPFNYFSLCIQHFNPHNLAPSDTRPSVPQSLCAWPPVPWLLESLGHIDLLLFWSGIHIARDVQVVIVLLDFGERHHPAVLGHILIAIVGPHDLIDILRPELVLLLALQVIQEPSMNSIEPLLSWGLFLLMTSMAAGMPVP